jgi:predicted peptidase
MCVTVLAWRGNGENVRIETPAAAVGSAGKTVAGITQIPPLSGPAATNQARFRAGICGMLPKVPLASGVYTDPKSPGKTLRYRLFKPSPLDRAKTYPLAIFLHGGGAQRSFDDLLKCSSPVFAFGPARLVAPEEQARHPAFVLVPWSGGRGWDEENTRLIAALLGELSREFRLDPKRVYVTGQSMGGYGTWAMIARYPELFAAGIPVCGGGDTTSAARAKDMAVWAFHGTADGIVPVSETRKMIDALRRAGGKPIYWEYTGGTHAGTAERAYCEPALLDWLFRQAKP